MLEMVHNPATITALEFINLQHSLTISYTKLLIELTGVDGLEHFWAELTTRSVLMPALLDLQKLIFSNKNHLIVSALARVCYSMTGFMLWITSFNRSMMSVLYLLLKFFLKVKAMYFKADSNIQVPSNVQLVHVPLALPPPSISSVLRVHSPLRWVHPESFDLIAIW